MKRQQYRPWSVDVMWAWGGRIADLPGDILDELADRISHMCGVPWDIRRAQRQVAVYAEQFTAEREAAA